LIIARDRENKEIIAYKTEPTLNKDLHWVYAPLIYENDKTTKA